VAVAAAAATSVQAVAMAMVVAAAANDKALPLGSTCLAHLAALNLPQVGSSKVGDQQLCMQSTHCACVLEPDRGVHWHWP